MQTVRKSYSILSFGRKRPLHFLEKQVNTRWLNVINNGLEKLIDI